MNLSPSIHRKTIINVLLPLLILSCSGNSEKLTAISGKVISIKDGDTIAILYDGKSLTIRLAHVDCPEKNQPFGSVAKRFTSDKCFGQIVTVENDNKYDRNKRLIGVIINSSGENVNKELIKAGLAWHYKKYSIDNEYSKLEIEARKKRIGLWSEANPTAPWNWRKK